MKTYSVKYKLFCYHLACGADTVSRFRI